MTPKKHSSEEEGDLSMMRRITFALQELGQGGRKPRREAGECNVSIAVQSELDMLAA